MVRIASQHASKTIDRHSIYFSGAESSACSLITIYRMCVGVPVLNVIYIATAAVATTAIAIDIPNQVQFQQFSDICFIYSTLTCFFFFVFASNFALIHRNQSPNIGWCMCASMWLAGWQIYFRILWILSLLRVISHLFTDINEFICSFYHSNCAPVTKIGKL